MLKFFTDKETRPFLPEVQALYDDFLFHCIDSLREGNNATALRHVIDDYKRNPYLSSSARTHLDDLEYLSEKADFELLKPAITNSESLGLLQEFLSTHKYKEFRDQANALRAPFILQTIISTPTSVKYYNAGRLIKSAANDSTGNVSITYSYNDKGQLVSILSLTMKNGQVSEEVQTNRLYDPQSTAFLKCRQIPRPKRTFTEGHAVSVPTGASRAIHLNIWTEGRLSAHTINKAY